MKALKILKPTVDILMLANFIILQSMKLTGGNLHEIFGMVLVFLMIVHIVANMKTTVQSFKNFGKLKAKFKLSLIVDILLITAFMACIVSGLLTSKFILHTNAPDGISVFHRWSGMTALIICLIHLGFHLSPILAKINKVYDNKRIAFLAECLIYCCMTFSLSIYAFRDVFFKDSKAPVQAENSHTDSRMVDSLPQSEISPQTNDNSSQNNSEINNDDSNSSKEDQHISSSEEAEPQESLEEYLSKMYCTGCHRHCPLTAPQCGRGQSKQQQAIDEYNSQYNTNETY